MAAVARRSGRPPKEARLVPPWCGGLETQPLTSKGKRYTGRKRPGKKQQKVQGALSHRVVEGPKQSQEHGLGGGGDELVGGREGGGASTRKG